MCHHFFLSVLMLTTCIAIPCNGYMMPQQPGMLGRLRNEATQGEKEDFLKQQSTKLADLDRDTDEFNRWVESEGLLTYYKRVLDTYNENKTIEKEYTDYMVAAAKQSPSKTKPLTPPAGYRLPAYRHMFVPLSEVLDKLDKINDTLSSEFFHMPSLPGVKAKKIDELRDRIKEYESKYLRPSDRDVREFAAPPDMVAKVESIKNVLESTENTLENVRTGLMNYLVMMGISDAEHSALRENPNDMKDMAKKVEDQLKELTKLPVATELQKIIYARYSSTPNLNQNPFLLPITATTTFLGAPLEKLNATINEHTAALMAANQFIRGKAVPQKDLIETITPKEPAVYFIESFIPPDINSMMQNSNVHEYMFKGYLGYWLQQIINQMFELKLSGSKVVASRMTLKELANAAQNSMIAPLLIQFPDLKTIPLITDCTAPTISLPALKQALSTGFTEPAEKGAALLQQLESFIKNPDTSKKINEMRELPTEIFYTTEGILFRKTLLVISLLAACALANPDAKTISWTPESYTTDICGQVPLSLFPTPQESIIS